MSHYILRLDDASDYMDVEKWQKIEDLLDKYNIKPLVGVIPDNQDPSLVDTYKQDPYFWDKVRVWKQKGWEIALHGCYHKYTTTDGGINPVNKRSEFAGVSFEQQCTMIRHGIDIFEGHGITPKVFFAPSHTFDENTILALKKESNVRIISDTIANKPYNQYGMTFIPQQSGHVRRLPFDTVTFCYHPNMMDDKAFNKLEDFLKSNRKFFVDFPIDEVQRGFGILDIVLKKIYFLRKK